MFKNISFFLFAVLFSSAFIFAGTGYYYYPDIRGDIIVFSSRGRLWKVGSDGGTAICIASENSNYVSGKISPDGQHIAYSMSVGSNIDIYLMPVNGGVSRRLTYYPGRDTVLGFSPDGRHVLFSSSRYHPHRRSNIFKVPIEGGLPMMVDIGKADLLSFADNADFIAFNRNAAPHATWKRYKGGRMSEIWAGSLQKNDFEQLTDFEGSNRFPMVYRDRIYFISDRKGRNNIFSMDFKGENISQHTFFDDFDINYPSLGDGSIVFQKAGDIYRYDIEKDALIRLDIILPTDNKAYRKEYRDASEWIDSFELSSEAQRVLLEIRGNLYITSVKEGRSLSLAVSPAVRFKNPSFSIDGSQVAYFSDETGKEQLYVSKTEDNARRIKLTDNPDGWYNKISWSPDGENIAFSDEKLRLYIYSFKSGKTLLIDRSDWAEIRHYSWSPCGKYLGYSKASENRFSDIYIHDLAGQMSYKITRSVTNDFEPVWDPRGEYLYFLSQTQFSPLMDHMDHEAVLTKMTRPHIVLLNSRVKNPLLPREWYELAKDEGMKRDKDNKDEDASEKSPVTDIEFNEIEKRIFPLPVKAGNYHELKAAKNKIYFLDREDRLWMPDRQYQAKDYYKKTLYSYNLKDRQLDEVLKGIDGYSLSVKKDKILYSKNNSLIIGDDTVDLARINLHVTPFREWAQIFNEAVRLQKLLYWAPNMGNIDWDGFANQYKNLLTRIGTGSELYMLIGELIGELATSHTYIFNRNYDFHEESISIGLLGADFEVEGDRYKITRIYEGDPFYNHNWSPLAVHPIREGDYLISVNGIQITADKNIYSYFENLADQEVSIAVSDNNAGEKQSVYTVRPIPSEYLLRYYEWVYDNRDYVKNRTGGKIGYVHIPDMSGFGLVEFFKQFFNQMDRDAVIIDDRYNGGGNVSQIILEKLRRELSYLSVNRHSLPRTSPRNVFLGHFACLINEDAGSDGDLFPEAFRMYRLGKLIGTRTWGGVVGIRSDKPFVDGGMMTIPEFSNYHLEKGWILENEGVIPDIEIINYPQDSPLKKDRQLDKAIEVLMEELRDNPVPQPVTHPYPDKTLESWIEFWEGKKSDGPGL